MHGAPPFYDLSFDRSLGNIEVHCRARPAPYFKFAIIFGIVDYFSMELYFDSIYNSIFFHIFTNICTAIIRKAVRRYIAEN